MSLSFSTLSAVACGVWASAKSPRPKSCGFRDTTFPAYDLETDCTHTVTLLIRNPETNYGNSRVCIGPQ